MGNTQSDTSLLEQLQRKNTPSNSVNLENTHNERPEGFNLNDILKDHRLQQQLKKNPEMKRKVLEHILSNFKHIMTPEQVQKINSIILECNNTSTPSLTPDKSNIDTEFENHKRRSDRYARQTEYQRRLNQVRDDYATALQVFGLSENFNIQQLKEAYKRLVIKYHPDKPSGNADKFTIIQKYYYLLEQELTTSVISEQEYDVSVSEEEIKYARDKFNLKKFNEMFEKYKLYDPNEEGYQDWLKEDGADEGPQLSQHKFSIDNFNSEFDKYKTQRDTTLTRYNPDEDEPQELVSCNGVSFTEIAAFSEKGTFDRYQESSYDLGYSDLKSAYTNGNLIDPNSVKYKTYKNIDELEQERDNISYQMSPEEKKRRIIQANAKEEKERQRQRLIRERDNLIMDTYNQSHQAMLGYVKGQARIQPQMKP